MLSQDPVGRLKEVFLASLNHEIRTPLSGLIGLLNLLKETGLNADQEEYLAGATECAGQLLDSLNLLLDYSSFSGGNASLQCTEFQLEPILEAAAADCLGRARAKGLRLVCFFDDCLPETVYGDPFCLRQVLQQVLRNAVKFTDEGEIRFNAHLEQDSPEEVRLRIQVEDTAIGIPEDKLANIFTAFQRMETSLARTHSGVGLGLALVDQILRRIDGRIHASSRPGQGSCFTLSIPFRPSTAAEEIKPAPAPARTAGQVRRVLYVDDNSVARQVVMHILSKAGLAVESAASAAEGIQAARQRQFDLVLMDLQMPEMDGLEATRELRRLKEYAAIPILALSAVYSDEYRDLCLREGMQGFLKKPVDKAELIAAVEAARPAPWPPAALNGPLNAES